MTMKKQYAAIDIGRYVSAMLVVAVHTYPFLEISETFNTFFIETICRLAVPYFFTISAYFLFGKLMKKGAQTKEILKKWLIRIGRLYLCWTVIYLPYTILNYAQAGITPLSLLSWLRDFLLNGSYYHLWFLPAIMLGMVIVWLLQKNFGQNKMLIAAAVLYLIGYLINIYAPIWESLPVISVIYGFFVKTIVTARDGIFFAPLFLGMGSWLANHRRLPRRWCAIGFILSFVWLILEVLLYWRLDILRDLSCMFLALVPCIFFLCQWLFQLDLPWKKSYDTLRHDSILMYTSQILFSRILFALLPDAHLVVYLLTLGFCQLFATLVISLSRKCHPLTWLM